MKAAALFSLGLAFLLITGCSSSTSELTTTSPSPAVDHKDASYEIEGRVITLAAGVSELEAAPGSASKITTLYRSQ